MALGHIARGGGQKIHRALNLARDLPARQRRDPGRREFNPQRQPGDELTNPPNSLALFRSQDKTGLGLARALQEQPSSAAPFKSVRVGALGKRQTLHFKDPLGL